MILKDILVKPVTIDCAQLATKARAILKKKKANYLIATEKGRPSGIIDLKHVIRLKDKKSNLLCKSLAEPVRAIFSPDLPLLDAAKLLLTSKSEVGIVLEAGKMRGVVDYPALLDGFIKARYAPKKMAVSDLKPSMLSISSKSSVSAALKLLSDAPAVAVLQGSKVVGVVSRHDFLRHSEMRQGGRHISGATNSPAVTVVPGSTVAGAAKMMVSKGLSLLPVVEGDSFAGSITAADLVSAYVG
ncbi:MAG: CBS domain-containing protein [archaeon]